MSTETHPAVSEAMREAVAIAEMVAKHLEERAAYFDSTNGHWDRSDTARSYRATANDVRRLKLPPLKHLASEIARFTGERDAALTQWANMAELVCEFAAEKAPDAIALVGADRDDWRKRALVAADAMTRLQNRAEAAEAETARLRAALEEIAKSAPETEPHPWDGELDTVCWNIAKIARAALSSQEQADV